MQRHRRAGGHGRIIGGKILIERHGYAAHEIVELGNGVHVHGHVIVDVDAQEEVSDRVAGVFAALLLAVAKAMGEAQLRRDGARFLPQHAKDGDLGHHVAVDVDGRDRLIFLIDDQQQKEVALAAAAEARAHVVVLQARVDAHEEDRFQPVAVLIGLAVLLQRRRFFKAIGEIAAHRARQSAAAQQRKTERHERQRAKKTGQIALHFHLFSMPPCATHFCVINRRFAGLRRAARA